MQLKVRFLGGEARQNRVEFYDGAESLFGISKTIKLASHYLFTGRVGFQAPHARGISLFMEPSRPGSYEQPFQVEFEGEEIIVNGRRVPVSAEVFKDFLAQAIGTTAGYGFAPQTDEVNEIFTSRPGDLAALNEALDGPAKQGHRFIGRVRSHKTTTLTPHDAPQDSLVRFDGETLDYLNTRIVSEEVEIVRGTVAAYNSNSTSGRFYVPELERTVPFKPEKGFKIRNSTPLTWSMNEREHGRPGFVQLSVRKVSTMRDVTKGYLLRDCDYL